MTCIYFLLIIYIIIILQNCRWTYCLVFMSLHNLLHFYQNKFRNVCVCAYRNSKKQTSLFHDWHGTYCKSNWRKRKRRLSCNLLFVIYSIVENIKNVSSCLQLDSLPLISVYECYLMHNFLLAHVISKSGL